MMANQARSVVRVNKDVNTHKPKRHPSKFSYTPLNPPENCIRLVKLLPADDVDDPVLCELIQVTFGELPEYNALSYMWGDEDFKEPILVNGQAFEVGENLWQALRHLRNHKELLPLWADALCINQMDIPERNQQLRIMSHIYTRARTVLVWLDPLQVDKSHGNILKLPSYLGLRFGLCFNSYWERVWIIQELCKARKIQICFDGKTVSWEEFIESILIHVQGDDRSRNVQRLAEQLRSKYTIGHTLQYLLTTHESSLSKDPRDKIYGFVGLATGCQDFPMDYRKSLLDVWLDTLQFVSSRELVKPADIVEFGRLVKRLLEKNGNTIATTEDIKNLDYGPRHIFDSPMPAVAIVEGVMYGKVGHIGPPPHVIISDLNATNEWTAMVQRQFVVETGAVNHQNDLFLQAMERYDKIDSPNLTLFPDIVRWEKEKTLGQHDYYQRPALRLMEIPHSENFEVCAPSQQVLFLFTSDSENTQWKMGIAPKGTRTGDEIIVLRGVQNAIIMRTPNPERIQVYGTARTSQDVLSQEVIGQILPFESVRTQITEDILVDARILYFLLS
jgi:Heterokaryon incompatibility protein (HET)